MRMPSVSLPATVAISSAREEGEGGGGDDAEGDGREEVVAHVARH